VCVGRIRFLVCQKTAVVGGIFYYRTSGISKMNYSGYFLLLTTVFITCIITANVIVIKFISLGPVQLPAGVILFPAIYILGDIFTEVYGLHRARGVIWLSFLCNLIFVFFAWLVQILPAAPFWNDQAAYDSILGHTPRILVASFAGSLVGQFSNSLILAKVKILTKGRWLWLRTISSTIVGEFLDSALFIFLAFAGTDMFSPLIVIFHSVAKIIIEILATPLTYLVVIYLKKKEGIDIYEDRLTFNPFDFW
jgi:uncharacterized integral membrane protein (TIGR00697 family)